MKKHILLGSLVLLAFTACKEVETVGNGPLDNRNMVLNVYYSYDTLFVNPNTMITNNVGARFFIQDVRMVVWNFNVVGQNDTTDSQDAYAVSTLSNPSVKVARFEPGTYQGFYGFTCGVDDTVNLIGPSQFEEGHPLAGNSLWNGPAIGYSFLTISGVAAGPTVPDTIAPATPFKFVIATPALKSNWSKYKTFVLTGGGRVTLDVQVDLEPMLASLPVGDIASIKSDPLDAVDYARAQAMQQIFQSQCVFLY